jgi:hypothetical protein
MHTRPANLRHYCLLTRVWVLMDGWFTEGLDAPDLKQGAALLDEAVEDCVGDYIEMMPSRDFTCRLPAANA